MRLRVSGRQIAEHALRTVSIGVLGLMLWQSLDDHVATSAVSARSGQLAGALPDWTTGSVAPARIAIRLDSAPTPRERDWLAALRGAGSDVTWSGSIAASAIAVQPVVSPKRGIAVMVAAPDSAVVELSDELGVIDSVRVAGAGAGFGIPVADGVLTARVRGTASSTALTDSVTIRRLLVIGAAGWESKFVVAALEEDGWNVDVDIRVAPGIGVSQGATATIDTSRYAAVIVLDASGAARSRQIAAYVRSGGGVILAGRAASADGFTELRVGATGSEATGSEATGSEATGSEATGSAMLTSAGPTTLRTLSLVPIVNPKPDALALDRRAALVAAAARRHSAGRVLQHGYADTWRWRMSGGGNSVDEHRRWWTSAVSSVAYAPRIVLPRVDETDAAPLAALTAALGPTAGPGVASRRSGERVLSMWWLFGLLSVSLIAEWASRRLRGAR